MTDLPDTYDPDRIESAWRETWADSDVYAAGDDPDFVIDTPPPYPTGDLHVGHALGWSYMDFVARYRRLQGEDVLFPQGWDCHGLPTEVKVEEREGIHRTDIPREEFRDLCIDFTEDRIAEMRETMGKLGFSQDWDVEYVTMDPDYWAKTQRSFVDLVDADYVYRDEFPVNWCPRCETAIADAEVETEEREGTLYYIAFLDDGGAGEESGSGDEGDSDEESGSGDEGDSDEEDGIEIATTRPELLPACVAIAVHPDDERHAERVGESFEVPLFGQSVDVIADDAVDPEFGTGAVMVCTFGDKQDVDWWTRYDLELRHAVTADGRLDEIAGEYAGVALPEAKTAIADDLEAAGYLERTEATQQSVGVCWRCETPIEIRSTEQWFVEVRDDEILEHAREVEWIPEHMSDRLEAWVAGMDWDWVISRQRVFATPIPAWFCEACAHVHVAERAELPVEPTDTDPVVEACPDCDATGAWTPETDVMDTWMDSSISALHVAGWPDEPFEPVALREQGHDIIRTWAFYTLLRTAALADATPWETALINGMVFGEDGRKMSKSRGNVVSPAAAIEEAGADAFRQALALGGQPGSDVQFRWKEVTAAGRFITKVWNVARFSTEHFDERTPTIADPAHRDADRWILARAAAVADRVAEAMDDYRFDLALRELREFVWHDLADDYLELVKGRLYEGRPGERDAARHALYTVVSATLRLLSPFSPFVTEECWDALPGTEGSIHAADWPDFAGAVPTEADIHDPAVVERGDLIAEVAAAVRGWKSEGGLALNAPLSRIEVYPDDIEGPIDTYDLAGALNGPVYVELGRPQVEAVPVETRPDHSVIGPEFRDRAGAVLDAIESMDPAAVADAVRTEGEVDVDVGGEVCVVEAGALEVVEAHRAPGGEPVEVVETDRATVLVVPDAAE